MRSLFSCRALFPPRHAAVGLTAILALGLFATTIAFGAPAHAQLGCLAGAACDPSVVPTRLARCDASCASGMCVDDFCLDGARCAPCVPAFAVSCPPLELVRQDGSRIATPATRTTQCTYVPCPGHAFVLTESGSGASSSGGPACIHVDSPPVYLWRDADCDGDGIPNTLDARACAANAALRIADGGLSCAPATFATMEGGCLTTPIGGPPEVSPALVSCMRGPGVFGVCCDSRDDCPISPGYSSRCVHLRSPDGVVAGVCTYAPETSPALAPEDTTCAALRGVPSDCFAEAPTSPTFGYTAWATGACEVSCGDDDGANALDPFVCGCPSGPTDAGTGLPDAFVSAEADAFVTGEADAFVSPGTDAFVVLDGSVSGPDGEVLPHDTGTASSFAGSGCRCTARAATSGRELLVSLLLVAACFAALGRRAARRA